MRILSVVQRYGDEVAGGAERHCRELATRLAARGHEVDVLRGARQTLAKSALEDILVEIVDHDGRQTRLEAVRGLLEPEGFALRATIVHTAPAIADYLFTRPAGRGAEHMPAS